MDDLTHDQRVERLKDIYRDRRPERSFTQRVAVLRELVAQGRNTIHESHKAIALAELSIEALEQLLAELQPCGACSGMGKVRVHIDQDTSSMETCERCDGSGRAEDENLCGICCKPISGCTCAQDGRR